jgi:hypothetical protein
VSALLKERKRWSIQTGTYGLTWEPEYLQSLIIDGLYQDWETNAYKEAMKEAEQFPKPPTRGSDPPTDLPGDIVSISMIQITHQC